MVKLISCVNSLYTYSRWATAMNMIPCGSLWHSVTLMFRGMQLWTIWYVSSVSATVYSRSLILSCRMRGQNCSCWFSGRISGLQLYEIRRFLQLYQGVTTLIYWLCALTLKVIHQHHHVAPYGSHIPHLRLNMTKSHLLEIDLSFNILLLWTTTYL